MGSAPQPGSTIQNYRLLEPLGEGGMGVVWLAEDTRLARKVAIKFLTDDSSRDPMRRERFEQEARAAAALNHPGIAAVYDLEECSGNSCIVFEYVQGRSLRHSVSPGGLACETLLALATDLAEALSAAHAAGIVHRDLKPENVMLTPEGRCKVLDFGLARFTASTPESATATHLTSAGMVVGTVAYMSPEQLEGKDVDFRSDIFSFGAMLYELATGVHPFAGSSNASTIAAVMTADPPPLTQRSALQPQELDRIVRKCLNKRREGRYQSTRDLAVDLRTLQQNPSHSARSAEASPESDDDNLFRGITQRLNLTPRRWWDLHQLFATLVYIPIYYVMAVNGAVRISESLNTTLAGDWQGWTGVMQAVTSGSPFTFWKGLGLPFFLVSMLLLIFMLADRLYLICVAMFNPVRLRRDASRVQFTLNVIYLLMGCQFVLLGWILLRVNDKELMRGAFTLGIGAMAFLAGTVVEPVMVRAAFPTATREESKAENRPRAWWWAHHLISMWVTTPAVVFAVWTARNAMPPALRGPVFWVSVVAIGLHWCARFALISAALGNPADLASEARTLSPWIRGTGWPVVIGLFLASLAASFGSFEAGAGLGVLAMGGVACLIFLDPAVERAAFRELTKPAKS